MPTDVDDVLEALEQHVDEEPVATAVDLAEVLPVTRRTVLSRLEALEVAERVASKDVGRGRVWWPVESRKLDLDDVDGAEPRLHRSSVTHQDETTSAEPPAEPPADSPETRSHLDVVDEVVQEASASWDGPHVEQRRRAARAALRWLRRRDEPATRSDVQEALLEEHPVDGQSDRTWWRKSVKPALVEARERDLVEYVGGVHTWTWIHENEA